MSAPYARFFTPPLHGGSFPLPRARDVVKTSVFTRPRKRDSSSMDRSFIFNSVLISFLIALALATGVGILGAAIGFPSTPFSWGTVLRLALLMEFVFILIFLVPYARHR